MVASGDEAADQARERLFPLTTSPSTPSNSRQKVGNDGEQEPLLQDLCQLLAVNEVSPALSNEKSSRCETTIPIFIASDRLTITNPAATASVHSSPSHCRDPLEITKAVCDFPAASAAASSFGSNGTHRRGNTVSSHDEVVTIQLLSGSDVNEARPALQQDSFECSWRGMCGPKPKRMTIIVFLALSVWASFIFGLNVHKQVSSLKTELSTMTDKVQGLHENYLRMKYHADAEIRHLKTVISHIRTNHGKLSHPPESESRRTSDDTP